MGASFAASSVPAPPCECEERSIAPPNVRLHVGSLPTLFAAPLHRATSAGRYANAGIMVVWERGRMLQSVPDATGAALSMLHAGLLDVVILPTEDAIAHAANSSQVRICGTFVENPRTWGLHVSCNASTAPPEADGSAVCGFQAGLGACAAAFALSRQRGCEQALRSHRRTFDTLKMAKDAMCSGQVSYVIWETQYSQSLVDRDVWLVLQQVTTAWPSWLIVASREALHAKGNAIRQFVEHSGVLCEEFKANPAAASAYIAQRYSLPICKAETWVEDAFWSCVCEVEESTLTAPLECLRSLGVVSSERAADPSRLLAKGLCTLERTIVPDLGAGEASPTSSRSTYRDATDGGGRLGSMQHAPEGDHGGDGTQKVEGEASSSIDAPPRPVDAGAPVPAG